MTNNEDVVSVSGSEAAEPATTDEVCTQKDVAPKYKYVDNEGTGCVDLSKQTKILKRGRLFLGDNVFVEVRRLRINNPERSFEYDAIVFTRKASTEGRNDFTFNLPGRLAEPLRAALEHIIG
jgi:hypothetical protein